MDAFDITGVSKSPAIFDIDKLTHFNALYLRAMSPEEFARVAEPYIRQSVKDPALDAGEIAALLQARCEKLTDIPEKVDFFDALPDYDPELFVNKKSKSTLDSSKEMLAAAAGMLANLPSWTTQMLHDSLVGLAEGMQVKNATLMWPVRIAAAGKAVTPRGGGGDLPHPGPGGDGAPSETGPGEAVLTGNAAKKHRPAPARGPVIFYLVWANS